MTACHQCGTENPDGFRFCGGCGAPLPVAVTEQRERRVVTTLFADLAGFTRRSERLDVEDVEGFLDPYFAVLREEVDRTGGVVAKFTGDGVMALFGAITAHEDDPERAVRCGLAICERVGDVAGELHVRVGITTGEAMVTLPDGGSPDAIGDVVNTAARLEAAAPTDGVLVDAWTYRATSRTIDYGEREPIAAKGKAEPVEVWVAHAPRSIIPEQQRDQLPVVGRDAETDTLRSTFERSRRERSAQLVTIIGEPGIGKTRLVDELYAYVADLPELITWRRGRSLAYGDGIAFWALGEMVKAQAGILESDSADVARTKLTSAVDGLGLAERDREWVGRHLGPLVGLEAATSGSDGSRVEAFAAWRRFLEALAERGPMVLVFEDIHWADDALLDFIELLAERAGELPILLICTARPELLERRAGWAGGMTNPNTISLTSLSDGDTARLVGGLLDQALLPADVQRRLLAQAGGNPLYAQEYVRMLQDRGLLVRRDAGWTLDGEIEDPPETVQGIIAARLDTLSLNEKSFLQDAAVIGRTAWLGAVCALTERNPWEADELLHGLERKQLIRRARRSSIDGETEFAFGHELTRDVAYSQIRRADRAQKHEAAAAWIERLAGERDDKAELLAEHYSQALTLREAIGSDTTALRPRALAVFREAGEQAAATYAHVAAARHYAAALRLAPVSEAYLRAALLLGQAVALNKENAADQGTLTAALEAQVAVGQWEQAAQMEFTIGDWYEKNEASGREAEVHYSRGAEYAARVPPSEVMCQVAAAQTRRLINRGLGSQALELADRMITSAEGPGLEAGRAQLLQYRGVARVETGDPDGVSDMRTAAEILARLAHERTPVALVNLADTVRGLGDMATADAAYGSAAEWARRFALTMLVAFVGTEQAYQAYHAGDWQTSRRLLTAMSATDRYTQSGILITKARIDLAENRVGDALSAARKITDHAIGSGNEEFFYYGVALEARSHHAAGRPGPALEACDRFANRWIEIGGTTGRAIELCEIAPILAGAARADTVRDAATLLPEACRWREALLLTAEGRYADAAALYIEIGSRPLAADTHLLAAQQAAANGSITDAAHYLDAVRDFADTTGANLYRRQAELLTTASA